MDSVAAYPCLCDMSCEVDHNIDEFHFYLRYQVINDCSRCILHLTVAVSLYTAKYYQIPWLPVSLRCP